MLKIGDYVVNSTSGICRIDKILTLDFSYCFSEKLYYLLLPIDDEDTKIYVPIDCKKRLIRKIMNEREAWRVIGKISNINEIDVEGDKEREEKYKEAVFSCDPEKLICIIKTMHRRHKQRLEEGKKKSEIDDKYFKKATNNLYSELAFATGKNKTEIEKIVTCIYIQKN